MVRCKIQRWDYVLHHPFFLMLLAVYSCGANPIVREKKKKEKRKRKKRG